MAKTKKSRKTEVSVVIPVYNEQESLPALFARLYPAMDATASEQHQMRGRASILHFLPINASTFPEAPG